MRTLLLDVRPDPQVVRNRPTFSTIGGPGTPWPSYKDDPLERSDGDSSRV